MTPWGYLERVVGLVDKRVDEKVPVFPENQLLERSDIEVTDVMRLCQMHNPIPQRRLFVNVSHA